MKRKLILLIGCFLLLLLAFGTYRFFLPDSEGGWASSVRTMPTWGPFAGGDPRMGTSREVVFRDVDDDGSLRGVFRADSISKEDDGSFRLENPNAEVFQKDGTRVYMSADRARLWAEEVGDGFDVSNGRMEGNVDIYFDRSKSFTRLHPVERRVKDWEAYRRDVMAIHTQNVEFSREMLELYTPNRVDIWSREVDLHGRDLRIQWNEAPRELRELRLGVVDSMIIKDMPQPMNPLPSGPPAGTTQPDETAQAVLRPLRGTGQLQTLAFYPAGELNLAQSETDENIEDAWNLPDGPPEETPDTSSADTGTDARAPGETTPPTTADEPAEKAPTTQTPPAEDMPDRPEGEPSARNVYTATCNENVRVFDEGRKASIVGAEKLVLTFEWEGGFGENDDADDDDDEDETQRAAAASQPTTQTQPENAPTSQAGEERDAEATDGEAELGNYRMEIHCDGPLVIRPVGVTETPEKDRYKLHGEGERVILSFEQGRALCKTFDYQNADRTITVRGDQKIPARLLLENGDEVICRDEIEIFGDRQVAYGRGPGTMNHFEESTAADAWASALAGQADTRDVNAQIFWGGHVRIDFGLSQQPTEDGGSKEELYVKRAVFNKQVQLARENPTEPGKYDYVRCDKLTTALDRDEDGRPYVSRADAVGSVAGRWGEAQYTADEATIYFEPVPEEPEETRVSQTDASDASEEDDGTMGFTGLGEMNWNRLEARGNVVFKQGSRASISTEQVEMWRGEDVEAGWSAKADGAGQLQFLTERGMGGETLDAPRFVRIKWTDRMDFDGTEGVATFTGGIAFDSGDDIMEAHRMVLHFDEVAEQPEPDGETDETADDPLLAIGIGDLASRDIRRIEIFGDPQSDDEKLKHALLKRTRFDPAMPQVMLQRVELRGEHLIYTAEVEDEDNPENNVASMLEVKGSGRFSHEDYQPYTEDEKKAMRTSNNETQLQRPSQTACQWSSGLVLNQQTNHLQLRDSVNMVHRSGKQILKIQGLIIPPWKDMDDGRVSKVRCDELDGWFADAEPSNTKPAEGTDMMQEMNAMGSLRKIVARKDVTMVDGDITVDAQRVIYDAEREVVNVWGYLEGQPQADARISRVDRTTQRTTTQASPELHWIMGRDDRPEKIVTGRIRGGGGT